jgi:16S rRNA (guanine527-N7)-methyltransferase
MAASNLPPDTRARRLGGTRIAGRGPRLRAKGQVLIGKPARIDPDVDASEAPIPPERLRALARQLELELSEQQCVRLLAYVALLRRWNRVHNLTAIDRAEDQLTHHLLDCLAIVRPLELALQRYGTSPGAGQPVSFLDAGSGAGLPGIPLALVHPDWQGHLVEAVQKKCAFLQQACLELQLGNLSVHHARLESCGLAPQSLVVSRAFASLRDFVALTRPLLAPNGLWAAMKGRNPEDEIRDLPANLEVLDTITLRVPLLEEQRHLVLLRPIAHALRAAAVPANGRAERPAGPDPTHR